MRWRVWCWRAGWGISCIRGELYWRQGRVIMGVRLSVVTRWGKVSGFLLPTGYSYILMSSGGQFGAEEPGVRQWVVLVKGRMKMYELAYRAD